MNTTLLGATGAAIVLLGFIMNQLKYWDEKELRYEVCNFLGSILLILYAIILKSYPFIVLNTIWALFSLKGIIQGFIKK